MLRIRRTGRTDPAVDADHAAARIALDHARDSYTDARQLGAEVRAVSAELRDERTRNHFAPLVVAAIRRRHP